MRLRRKPWIEEAIKNYTSILFLEEPTDMKGKWETQFPRPEQPLHVEFGTGKGQFISGMAALHPDVNYIGMEVQEGVIYYAAQKRAVRSASRRITRIFLISPSKNLRPWAGSFRT